MISERKADLAMFAEADVAQLRELLSEPRRICITTHKNPDGDAIGSTLGLWWVLMRLGHDVRVVVPNAFDHFLAWMPGSEEIINAWRQTKLAEELFRDAEIVFCLDFGASKRVGDLEDALTTSLATKVMIDHHLDPESWPDLLFHKDGMSSTAELVYRLFVQLGHLDLVDDKVAQCLYTGLMTDTGSFRFSSTTADVHRITARLLDTGIDPGAIHNHVYDNFSETRTRFLGYLLFERMVVIPHRHTAYITIHIEDIQRFDVKAGDTEGVVNYGLSLKGINFAVLMKETPEGTKLSFRSIGQFACNDFASHFGGGGHHNASGGRVDLTLPETEKKFLSLLEEYRHQLDY